MVRRPPRSTRTDTLFPYTTLCRSGVVELREGATVDQELREAIPLLLGAVAPLDGIWLEDACPVLDPRSELLVVGGCRHLLSRGVAGSALRWDVGYPAESGGTHVDLGAEAEPGGARRGVDVEDHALALAEHPEHRSLQGIGCEVVLPEVGVAEDHAVTRAWVVRLDDSLHGPSLLGLHGGFASP